MGNQLQKPIRQISVGNVIEMLNRHFTCYSPSNHFKKLSLNQKEKDAKIINRINYANDYLGKELVLLYKDMLFYRKGNATLRIIDLLKFLKEKYAPLVESLKSEETQYAKILYKEWKIEWMLDYIQYSVFLSDREFAEDNHIDLDHNKENNPSILSLMSRERMQYFDGIELDEEYTNYRKDNEGFPEIEEFGLV